MAIELGFVDDLLLPMIVAPINWEFEGKITFDGLISGNSIKNGMYLFNNSNSRYQPLS
jgi:hypothetical protein